MRLVLDDKRIYFTVLGHIREVSLQGVLSIFTILIMLSNAWLLAYCTEGILIDIDESLNRYNYQDKKTVIEKNHFPFGEIYIIREVY